MPDGSSGESGSEEQQCPRCEGDGETPIKGTPVTSECGLCNGSGEVTEDRLKAKLAMGLPVVATNLDRSEITLHRDDHPCSQAPTKNADHTDLMTATVGSKVNLCSRCDWPEGSEEVLKTEDSVA